MDTNDRTDLVNLAKYAEQSERYEDMVEFMRKLALQDVELTVEERNLFSVAFKNVVGARRNAWRTISTMISKFEDEGKTDEKTIESARKYLKEIETELEEMCNNMIVLLDEHLIPHSSQDDALVFMKKMKGDYYRYLAECFVGDKRDTATEKSLAGYKQAKEQSDAALATTHPIRLGLALNFSVFYYEINNEPKQACRIAKQAFDDAICDLDQLGDDSYKDSTLIMQLLRDNLTLWTADEAGEKE